MLGSLRALLAVLLEPQSVPKLCKAAHAEQSACEQEAEPRHSSEGPQSESRPAAATPDQLTDEEVARLLVMTQPHLMAEPNFAQQGQEAVPASHNEAQLLNESMFHIERGLQGPVRPVTDPPDTTRAVAPISCLQMLPSMPCHCGPSAAGAEGTLLQGPATLQISCSIMCMSHARHAGPLSLAVCCTQTLSTSLASWRSGVCTQPAEPHNLLTCIAVTLPAFELMLDQTSYLPVVSLLA